MCICRELNAVTTIHILLVFLFGLAFELVNLLSIMKVSSQVRETIFFFLILGLRALQTLWMVG
jgi:hypothetical protein